MAIQEKLLKQAEEVFARNRVEFENLTFHIPSPGTYEELFAWDSGWNALALGALSPETALRELQSVFAMQKPDGMIPHETRFKALEKNNRLGRKVILRLIRRNFDSEGKSMLLDPPSYLMAAEEVYRKTRDQAVLDLLPAMIRTAEYLLQERDVFGDGMAAIIHPWESGTDNAPYFDEIYGIRGDTPFWMNRFEWLFKSLIDRNDRMGWNTREIAAAGIPVIEDVGFNGLLARGLQSLGYLCTEAGKLEDAETAFNRAARIIASLENHLWDGERGFFYPRWNPVHPRRTTRTCLNGAAPLLTGLVSPEKAEGVLEKLASPEYFSAPRGLSFNALCEEDLKNPYPRLLWRGRCQWINMNWIAAEAASKYGRQELARSITRKTAALIDESGFREYYCPLSGKGFGARGFTWPALVADMLEKYD